MTGTCIHNLAEGLLGTSDSTTSEQPKVWEIFDNITSPRQSIGTGTMFLAVTSSAWVETEFVPYDALITSSEVPNSLAIIRQAFSLSTVELSKVFNVSRQTIYDWADGPRSVSDENRQRISSILTLASDWNSRELGPLGRIVREPIDGISLLDGLSTTELDIDNLLALLNAISSKVNETNAKSRIPSANQLIAKHSGAQLSERAYQRNLGASSARNRKQ